MEALVFKVGNYDETHGRCHWKSITRDTERERQGMGACTFVTSEYWFIEEELVDVAANDDDEKRPVAVITHHE